MVISGWLLAVGDWETSLAIERLWHSQGVSLPFGYIF